MTSRVYAAVVAVWIAAAVVSVAWVISGPRPAVGVEEGALPPIPSRAGAAASFETEDTLPSALGSVAAEAIQGGWTGPGGRDFFVVSRSRRDGDYRYRPFGRETFYLGLRLDEGEGVAESCSSCHFGTGEVGGRTGQDAEGVHRNIEPVHPDQAGAQCRTCHAPTDPARLRLEGGGEVGLDHAYRLCAQCHFQQVDSWAFGAHGKRLVGWRGRRVVMNCADCHDPHRPATEIRMPMAGPTLPVPLTGESESEGGEGHE